MWANHDWIDIQPDKLDAPDDAALSRPITPETFDRMTDYVIAQLLQASVATGRSTAGRTSRSTSLPKLMETFGGVEATRAALEQFRDKTKAAGFPDLHLNAVMWGQTHPARRRKPADPAELVDAARLRQRHLLRVDPPRGAAEVPARPIREGERQVLRVLAGGREDSSTCRTTRT